MTRKHFAILLGSIGALAVLAVAIPVSPFYLPRVIYGKPEFEGHSAGHWVQEMDNPNPEIRMQAITALGSIGDEASEGVSKLAECMLKDLDPEARYKAALALSKMIPSAKAAVPALAKALEDKEPFVRLNAVNALFRLGSDARPAMPELIKAMQDETNKDKSPPVFGYTIQDMAARALGKATAGSGEAVPALMATLKQGKTDGIHLAVAKALGDIGPEARNSLPQLRELLKDNNLDVRQAAQESIEIIEGQPAN
jgi:HEAT repeat protein